MCFHLIGRQVYHSGRERERLKTWIYKLSMKPLGINEISVTETGIEWKGGGEQTIRDTVKMAKAGVSGDQC